MLDFVQIHQRTVVVKHPEKHEVIEVYPKFIIGKSSDLMIKGSDFYAIWLEEKKLWSTDEQDLIDLIDKELLTYAYEMQEQTDMDVFVSHMWDADTGNIDRWHKYCQKQLRDSFVPLDETLVFANTELKRELYASRQLSYPLEKGSYESWDKLIGTLYTEKERHKIEWVIGSIVNGASKEIQKFMVLYGAAGTGKSTVINIIMKLFQGYVGTFNSKSLGRSNDSFALEAFKDNPLVAIQHDGDLSKLEDNTRLNSLVSHEEMTVNEKFKSAYTNRFNAFLIMGTNKPVKITDAKSGLLRRLIDCTPSGDTLPADEYFQLMHNIDFELGAIAYHCKEIYEENPRYYDKYVPTSMFGATNDFYNFVMNCYDEFEKEDGVSLKMAWDSYKKFCEYANVQYQLSYRPFSEELKNYFHEFKDRHTLADGTRVRSYYKGFKKEQFENMTPEREGFKKEYPWLNMQEWRYSTFDVECADCIAQYANAKEAPSKPWDEVDTKLSDLDTSRLHYVRVPLNHIVIDFDMTDESGNKSLQANLEAASKWPPTYAEVSKGGSGLHLHYYYTGDPTKLSRVYDDRIEVKVFNGKGSLRRKLTLCNNYSINTISSGLPIKESKPVINKETVLNEKAIRTIIRCSILKEYQAGTKPNVDFIKMILDRAYESGIHYDVTDLEPVIWQFAENSTHHSDYCVKQVKEMKFKSDEASETNEDDDRNVFFDIEVFPNVLFTNWKYEGAPNVNRMINPSPEEIEELAKKNLIGFYCRRYDNHILYARMCGASIEKCYKISQGIIVKKDPSCFFGEAYNLSKTDVYDFSSKKQSLKKFEIELAKEAESKGEKAIHHMELGLPWDEPVDPSKWEQVAEYCDNDVIATEAVFHARHQDYVAREILAALAGGTVNDTTNQLTTRIVFGDDWRRPDKTQFNYRDMGDDSEENVGKVINEYTVFDKQGRPIFPGYKYKLGTSTYRDEEVGEGGYVYAEPGIYTDVALLDVASMHPNSAINENVFGEYTNNFKDILEARIAIKHKDFDKARTMLGGKLSPFLEDPSTAKDLSGALKIAINSVYGLTSAGFDNAFKDPRNVDNIVAKRGALFMINLKHEVRDRGFTVAHIKTDSIKIPNATPEIIQFVMDYGKMYGYTFEHEATYERMCLVNDAVYIAAYASKEWCEHAYGYVPEKNEAHPLEWTATGKQFAVPYVFKKLFSHEDITLDDLCEVKSVDTALFLDMNENLEDTSKWKNLMELRTKKKLTKKDQALLDTYATVSDEELEQMAEKGHNRKFIGKVENFCPVKPGYGGGILLRQDKENKHKFNSASGCKGYRWLETEVVRGMDWKNVLDYSYFNKLVDDAADAIAEHGDLEWFLSAPTDTFIDPIAKDNLKY